MNKFNTLTVYLGSSGKARPVFKQAAEDLGRIIAKNKKHLVYGGMDAGLMGVLARTAMDNGGEVTGIIPQKIKDSERILRTISRTILVDELCDRKKEMFTMADAVLALPGGFGTLDESLEILYWGNLKLHYKPLVLINIDGYWDDLTDYLYTLPDFDPRFLIVVDKVDQVFDALKKWDAPPPVITPRHLPHFEDEITRRTNMPLLIDIPSVENTYFAACALGLKQLGRHDRGIGFLNTNGQFDALLRWAKRAEQETFITPKCLKLFDAHEDEMTLRNMIRAQEHITIDLHNEKWGEATAPNAV